jgi:hypothetical protein
VIIDEVEAAMEMLEEFIWTYGKLEEITTDDGGEFIGDQFEAMCA